MVCFLLQLSFALSILHLAGLSRFRSQSVHLLADPLSLGAIQCLRPDPSQSLALPATAELFHPSEFATYA